MKKIIYILGLLVCLNVYSQVQYVYKGNGGIINTHGDVISPTQIRSTFKDNEKVLELYNVGRTKKTLGNIMLYGGLGFEIGYLVYTLTNVTIGDTKYVGKDYFGQPIYQTVNENRISAVPAIVAGIIIIAAIPIKIGFSKKVKKAVNLMNDAAPNKKVGFIESTSILLNQNGVGIAMKF